MQYQLMESMEKDITLPFLKWAGGKRWLVEKHSSLLSTNYKGYIEPFLGSGATFFSLQPQISILCDKNKQLIETYQAIKDDWSLIKKLLIAHNKKHSKEYYYEVRSKKFRSAHSRAAQFIYLNRTCWNGLYRVNLAGQFNVPIGTKKSAILDTDDFEKVAKLLSNATLLHGDFEQAISLAEKDDFVFVDPPYTVKHNYNGFVKYNESIFSWEDQVRLKECVVKAISKGAQVLVTNAHHDSIRELYKGIGEHISLNRSSVIAGKATARGTYEEVAIKCF